MANIALVVLDTLRKDAFDEYFSWHPGVRFENAYSTSGWTVPAHATMFTGRYPSEAGVVAKSKMLTPDRPVLAEVLSSEGYTTRGFSANANISDAFQFTRGFDEFHHSWRGRRHEEHMFDWSEFISRTRDRGWSRFPLAIKEVIASENDTLASLRMGVRMKARDLGLNSFAGKDDGAQKALELVKNASFGTDEFLFLNLMEVHTPYEPPDEYKTVDIDENPSFGDTMFDGPNEDPEVIRQAYNDCARYLSDMYEKIFDELVNDFDFVLTVSDHGEMFGRDGIWAHNLGVYPELVRVPLSIYSGSERTVSHDETVSLLDIYSTVLAIAGKDTETAGRNLLSVSTSEQYLIERHGLRASRLETLTESGYDRETIERYDEPRYGVACADGTYGWEGRETFMSSSDSDHRELRERISRTRSDLDTADIDHGPNEELPEDVRNRLEELGYM